MRTNQKKTAKYMEIVAYIEECIKNETLKPQDQLPKESELMEQFHISSITVRKAMEIMAQNGVIYRVKGKGTFVADPDTANGRDDSARKIHLVFDEEETLDTSLMQIVQGIQRYCKKRSSPYLLLMEDYTFCEEFLRFDKGRDNDAGLIIYIGINDGQRKLETLRRLSDAGAKFVCIDRYLGNDPVNYVGCNNHDAVYSAVEHLLELGHRHIGFLFEVPKLSSEQERYAGYANAMCDHGLADCIVNVNEVSNIEQCMNDLKKNSLTAVVCANDFTASVLVKSLKIAGLDVPNDISVVGFDDSQTYRYHRPRFTTLRQDFQMLGYESARVLDRLMKKITVDYTKIYIPTQLIVRDSTRKIEDSKDSACER